MLVMLKETLRTRFERPAVKSSSYHIIRVLGNGQIEKMAEGPLPTTRPYPTQPGTYQFRPVASAWSAGPEYGFRVPVYDWAKGVLKAEEIPSLEELPSIGTLPVSS